eukprot:COSAG06_NODE_29764_length_550_cov_2.725055_1_plen_79_part_00
MTATFVNGTTLPQVSRYPGHSNRSMQFAPESPHFAERSCCPSGKAMGSSKFHGSAGELGTAIKALHEAMAQRENEDAA